MPPSGLKASLSNRRISCQASLHSPLVDVLSELIRNHAEGHQLPLQELRPPRDGRFCRPKPNRMPAFNIDMNLCGDAGFLSRALRLRCSRAAAGSTYRHRPRGHAIKRRHSATPSRGPARPPSAVGSDRPDGGASRPRSGCRPIARPQCCRQELDSSWRGRQSRSIAQ
jgi:hypothetical protein